MSLEFIDSVLLFLSYQLLKKKNLKNYLKLFILRVITLKYEILIKHVLGESNPKVIFQWRKKRGSVNILSTFKKIIK